MIRDEAKKIAGTPAAVAANDDLGSHSPALLAFADDLADLLVEVYLASLSSTPPRPDLGQDSVHG